jgi:hypothetical protein
MSEDAHGPRAIPLPPDTKRDARLPFLFRPSALPWVLGAVLWGVAVFILPAPAAAKALLGLVLPGGWRCRARCRGWGDHGPVGLGRRAPAGGAVAPGGRQPGAARRAALGGGAAAGRARLGGRGGRSDAV